MDSSLALYGIYDDLRSSIKSGELRAEAVLDKSAIAPNASDADYSRAIGLLVDEGLLQKDPLNALSVAKVRARSKRGSSFHEDYISQGRLPSTQTISLALTPIEEAPGFVKGALKESQCSMLIRHYHLQSVDGVPHALADSYVPYELAGKYWKGIKDGNHDIFNILFDLGLKITEKQETLYVDAPKKAERERLGMLSMPGLQVVRLDCIVWAGTEVVEVCLLCDRADLYEFTYRVSL